MEYVKTLGSLMLVIIVATLIGCFVVGFVADEWCKTGNVTGKYILPRFTGEPIYYLILDNETDVKTNEEYYYKYNVGDYYNPCNR